MNRKKSGWLMFLLLVSAFLVSCQEGAQVTPQSVWDRIISIGQLEFLGLTGENALVGFMRILVFILIFAILFELANLTGFLSRNIAIAVSAVLAIMSAVFIPGPVLAGIGASYAILVSLILIGIPVVGGLYAIFRIPSDTRTQMVLKIVILLILLWVLIAVKTHASGLAGVS